MPGLLAGSVVGMQGERAGEPAGPDVWETCRELIPAGSVFAFLAGHREALFPAAMFADMYPSPNGRPSLPPQVLATVVVLQALQGLPDFETVQQARRPHQRAGFRATDRQFRLWPARCPVWPMRCRNVATLGGSLTWMTRSRSPTPADADGSHGGQDLVSDGA